MSQMQAAMIGSHVIIPGMKAKLLLLLTGRGVMQTAMYQRKLLQVAVQLLKPGGHLVYSTCTVNPGAHKPVKWHSCMQFFAAYGLAAVGPLLCPSPSQRHGNGMGFSWQSMNSWPRPHVFQEPQILLNVGNMYLSHCHQQ